MDKLEKLKIYLGSDRATAYSDELLNLILADCEEDAISYCNNKTIPDTVIVQMGIVKLNKLGSEGITTQSLGGNSESFEGVYSNEVVTMLDKYRRVKFL